MGKRKNKNFIAFVNFLSLSLCAPSVFKNDVSLVLVCFSFVFSLTQFSSVFLQTYKQNSRLCYSDIMESTTIVIEHQKLKEIMPLCIVCTNPCLSCALYACEYILCGNV